MSINQSISRSRKYRRRPTVVPVIRWPLPLTAQPTPGTPTPTPTSHPPFGLVLRSSRTGPSRVRTHLGHTRLLVHDPTPRSSSVFPATRSPSSRERIAAFPRGPPQLFSRELVRKARKVYFLPSSSSTPPLESIFFFFFLLTHPRSSAAVAEHKTTCAGR